MHKQGLMALAVGWAVAVSQTHAEESKPAASLNDFLTDFSGSYVGAAGIIGLDGKLVRDVATPKEFVASINTARNSESKDGIGFAFTPGRSRFERAAVNIRNLDKEDQPITMPPLRRLWGSTTFSYAQSNTTIGSADYKQRALAVNIEYYLHLQDDPAFAALRKFRDSKSGSCAVARAASKDDPSKLAELQQQARNQATNSHLVAASADAAASAAARAVSVSPSDAAARTRAEEAAARARSAAADAERKKEADTEVSTAISDCAKAASDVAKTSWNAPKATLLYGRGQIRGTGPSDPRLSLGNHLQFTVSMAPENVHKMREEGSSVGSQNQLTLSINRATNVLDTTTIAGTPVYKSSTKGAIRYTRAWDGELTSYLLAQASTVKTKDGPIEAGSYKYAIGWDYKLGANMWIELRRGRSIARTGDKEETKTLVSLKISPDSKLASLFTP